MIERTEILRFALVGYQARREEIERRIADLQRRLNGAAAVQEQPKPKRRLSAKGRAAIAKATKERWRRVRAAGRKRLG